MIELLRGWERLDYRDMLIESPGLANLFEWIIDHIEQLQDWDQESVNYLGQALDWFDKDDND
jgi:hypothetical protein